MAAVIAAPAVTAQGQVAVDLELNRSELQALLWNLKAGADASRPGATAAQQAPVPGAAAARQPSPVPAPAPVVAQRQPAPAPAIQQRQPTPPLPDQQRQASPAPAVPQRQEAGSDWQVTWTTDAMDHDGEAVTAMACVSELKGLPGGDGHGGWLLSVSESMVNLWELSSARHASGEPGLMLMHSQMKDKAAAYAVDAEPAGQRLLMATHSKTSREPCVATHTLSPEGDGGFLSEQPVCLLRPVRPSGAPAFQRATQVVSLHSWGGPLTGTCAAAFDSSVLVFPMTRTGARPVLPKAEWRAHAAAVTALHRSTFSIHLFTGGADGKAHMWDMTGKPTAPTQSFAHGAAVTKVLQVREDVLAVAGADGNITLWHPRRGSAPLRRIAIGAGRITALAVSGPGDVLLAGTPSGVFHVNLSTASGGLEKLPTPPGWATAAVVYNSRTGSFYASSIKGTVSCFARLR